MFYTLKKWKYIPLTFQKLTLIVIANNFLRIPNEDKKRLAFIWQQKKLSALLKGIAPKHGGDFCCLNYLHSFKLKSYEKSVKINIFCGTVLPFQKDNILQFNQYMKSDKMPHIIYADL